MSALRRLLEGVDAGSAEEPVEFEGDKFLLKGSPDADLYWRTIMASDKVCKGYALNWRARWPGKAFSYELVREILGVHATLQPEEGEQPYDIVEIAELAIRKGPCFIKLSAAAAKVMGLTEKTQGNEDPTLNPALGNSSGGAPQDSSSAVSTPPATTPNTSDE